MPISALVRWSQDLTALLSVHRSTQAQALRYLLAASFPIVAGLAAHVLSSALGVVHVSFLFITSVICAGALCGVRPALLAAAIAFCIYNFFLVEPRYSLQLATADDFITLLLFLLAALLTGGLAGRLREHAALSQQQLRTTQALLDASQKLSREAMPEAIRAVLAQTGEQALGSPTAVLHAEAGGWRIAAAAPSDFELPDAEIALCRRIAEGAPADLAPHISVSLMHDRDGRLTGALIAAGDASATPPADRLHHQRTLDSLANLGSVAIERSLLASEMSKARALAETERLRSALLSSLSHDFRTPLATIMASSTSLLDYETHLDAAAKRELAQIIREETEGLSAFVANLLEMTRLEAGELRPRLVEVDLADIGDETLAAAARQGRSRGVTITHRGETAPALADPMLLERALSNIIENAITFSEPGGKIELHTHLAETGAPVIAITDEGPGVPADMQAKIFEKFVRGDDQGGRKRGVGLGLSIALALIETMGGSLRVESPVREGRGSRFVVTLSRTERKGSLS